MSIQLLDFNSRLVFSCQVPKRLEKLFIIALGDSQNGDYTSGSPAKLEVIGHQTGE